VTLEGSLYKSASIVIVLDSKLLRSVAGPEPLDRRNVFNPGGTSGGVDETVAAIVDVPDHCHSVVCEAVEAVEGRCEGISSAAVADVDLLEVGRSGPGYLQHDDASTASRHGVVPHFGLDGGIGGELVDLVGLERGGFVSVGYLDLEVEEAAVAQVDVVGLEVVAAVALQGHVGLSSGVVIDVEVVHDLVVVTVNQGSLRDLSGAVSG